MAGDDHVLDGVDEGIGDDHGHLDPCSKQSSIVAARASRSNGRERGRRLGKVQSSATLGRGTSRHIYNWWTVTSGP